MALVPQTLVFKPNPPHNHHFPTFTCHIKPSLQPPKNTPHTVLSRRAATTSVVISSILVAKAAVFDLQLSEAFDFGITAPDQTLEEAVSGVRVHAKSLLNVKSLLESSPPEAWKEARKEMRKSASALKQDIYTIIQGKAGSERPQLRKLYSKLFNSVTGLEYAARDKDAERVWECYENIVTALDDIFARI